MKKSILIFTFLNSCLIFAQNPSLYYGFNEYATRNMESDYLKGKKKLSENNIASSKLYEKDKKGNTWLASEIIFDHQGNFIDKTYFNKKGKKTNHHVAVWTEDGKMTSFDRRNKNDESQYLTTWVFNQNGTVDSYISLRKGKPHFDGIYKYQDSLLVEAQYGSKGKEERKRWVYSYYPDGQKKQTISYNKKGKESHRWSYACDTEGKQIKKAETEVCKKSEFDSNGLRKEVYLYTDEKQKTRKLIMIYDKSDQLVGSERYNKNDEIISKEINEYDENGNRTMYKYFSKNRLRSHVIYEYNSSNLVVKQTFYNKNQEVRLAYSQEYSVF